MKGFDFILGSEGKGEPGERAPGAEMAEAREDEVYDLIIVGGGPAGLSAAVYAARKRLRVLLVSKDIGGQVLLTSEVENYIGYQYIDGRELIEKFRTQVEQFPIAMALGEEVISIAAKDPASAGGPQGGGLRRLFAVRTASGRSFSGKSLIVATGKRSRPLNVPGERELIGRGVSYCATCDAPLFGGQHVAVVGGGNSAFTAVNDLVKIAEKIYVINVLPNWQADQVLIDRAMASGKVEGLAGYEVKEIVGRGRVEAIRVASKEKGEEKEIPVKGVFIEIGLIPNSEPVKGFLETNKYGEIIVDCGCETSQEGVFAAGDVTTVPEKQIIVAAGEGAKAALGAYKYLLMESGGVLKWQC